MPDEDETAAQNGLKTCGRCGAAFTCGLSPGHAACWCAALPHVMPLEQGAADCLCPDCLRAEVTRRLAERPS